MRPFALLLGVLSLLCAVLVPALADYGGSRDWFNRLSVNDRTNLQLHLILTGHYSGFADARFGPITYQALLEFEREQRLFDDGILNRNEADRLLQVSEAVHRQLDLRVVADNRTGIQMLVPGALFAKIIDTELGRTWESADGSFALDSLAFDDAEVPFQLLFGLMASKMNLGNVTYQKFEDRQFVLSGEADGGRFYALVTRNGAYNSGFVFRWTDPVHSLGMRTAVYIAASARFFPASVSPDSPPGAETAADSDHPPAPLGSGSGFFVSTTGLVLTNFHVIRECGGITVKNHGKAEILRISIEDDLAVLLVGPLAENRNTAIISPVPPPLGSSIVAGGFPLADIFGSQFTVAFGQVTSRRGLKGTKNQYSMSVPVQPGNSGGPVVNDKGEVVGIATAKLNDAVMMEVAGTTGANFSFAIDPRTAANFLKPFRVETRNALIEVAESGSRRLLTNEERVANMETYTAQIICEPLQR